MTVGAIGLLITIAILALGIAGFISLECETNTGKALVFVIAGFVIISTFIIQIWYYHSTESGKRAMKSQESNFNAGIERRLRVYDVDGDLLQTYEGKFDVDYDSDRIIFDDEDGKRHIIYYPTGTVIIDEI